MSIQANKVNTLENRLVGRPWTKLKISFSGQLLASEIPAEKPEVESFLDTYLNGITENLENISFRYTWNASAQDPRVFIVMVSIKTPAVSPGSPSAAAKTLSITRRAANEYTIDGINDRSTKNTVKLSPPPTGI